MSVGTETATPERPAMRALATVLDLLAEIYLQPDADIREKTARLADDERLAATELESVASDLRFLGNAPDAELEVEYVRLFLHGGWGTAHPYESFYRSGQLADEACLDDLESLLAAAGVEPDGHRVTPDHLGVELDFLALLLAGLADEDLDQRECESIRHLAERLLLDHLTDFVAAFVARVQGAGPDPYHQAATQLLADAVAAAGRMVSALSGRSAALGPVPKAIPERMPGTPA
jgi:TorA maturation chaperone TorD